VISHWLGLSAGTRPRFLPWPIALLIVIAVHAVSIWLIGDLRLNNALEIYYPPGSPAVKLRDTLRSEFPSDEALTVIFQGDQLYTRDFLERLDELAMKVGENPLVDRVATITTLEHVSGSSDGFAVEPLLSRSRIRKDSPAELRERVLGDRFAPGLLASRDGTVLAMAVRPKQLAQSADRLALKIAVISAINELGMRPQYAGDAGQITVDVAQLQSSLEDTNLFLPLTVALGLVLLFWVVGRLRPVVIGTVAMSTVILPVLAGIAAFGKPHTMVTAILPSLLAAYTMVTLMHLYAGVQRAQTQRLTRGDSVRSGWRETFSPSAFNVLTTSGGLLSLALVPMPPVQVFGVAGAFGTLTVFLVTYFLVPPFLVSWDNRRWPTHQSTMGRFGHYASKIAIFGMRRPVWMVAGTVTLLVVTVPLVMKLQVETDVLTYFDDSHPVNRDIRTIESHLVGTTSLEVSIRATERDALQRVEVLTEVASLQRWMEAQPEVDRAVSMVDLVEEMHWAMNGEQPAFRTLPPNDRLLRQYLLVYDGSDLYELVNRDYSHLRVMLNLKVHGARQIDDVIQRIRDHVQTQPLPGLSVDVGGYGRLFADQVDLLVSGQVNSFFGAFALIFLLMAALWRSFRSAAICLVPTLAPLYFVIVLMGATGVPLDMATVMIASVVLGITVDDTIHLYHAYRERRLRGVSQGLAVARAYRTTGRAVISTSVLLTAQFGLLALSDFNPTSNFGMMTAIGMLAGQAAELLLLPALLVLTDRRAPAVPARSSLLGKASRPVHVSASSETIWPPAPMLGTVSPAAQSSPAPAAVARARDYVFVCRGEACRAKGGDQIWHDCLESLVTLRSRGAEPGAIPVETGCVRRCEDAPVVLSGRLDLLSGGADDAPTLSAQVQAKMMRSPSSE
jgi:predicted RND superfamily exporter protein